MSSPQATGLPGAPTTVDVAPKLDPALDSLRPAPEPNADLPRPSLTPAVGEVPVPLAPIEPVSFTAPGGDSVYVERSPGYLGNLNTAQRVLWCYLIWYLEVFFLYFDASAKLWLGSLGISAIVGTGLYLSTVHAARTPAKLDRWQVFRLYAMPFCVSSFAALIKDRGFVLIFHPTLGANLQAAGLCLAFVGLCELLKKA